MSARFRLQFLEKIGMFMIWCEVFRYIAIGRYVLISYIAVNDPYVIRLCFMTLRPVLRLSTPRELLSPGFTSSSVTRRLLREDRRHATPPRCHVATSQPLMARWHDFKSINVARDLIPLWPLCHRFDRVPTKTSKQKQTGSKQ